MGSRAQSSRASSWRFASAMTTAMLVSAPLRAGEPALIAHYSAPPGCPTEAHFAADLQRAMSNAQRAPAGIFDVRIEQDGGRHRGRLAVVSPRSGGVREVEGDSCAEVSGLLAFAAALAIEPYVERSAATVERSAASTIETPERPPHAATNAPLTDLALTFGVAVFSNEGTSAMAAGVTALVHRRWLVVGAVGDVGVAGEYHYWDVGAAVGLAVPSPEWLRVDVLSVGGVQSYSGGAAVAFAGLRPRVGLEVAHLAVGLEGRLEALLGSRDFGNEVVKDPPASFRPGAGLYVGGTLPF